MNKELLALNACAKTLMVLSWDVDWPLYLIKYLMNCEIDQVKYYDSVKAFNIAVFNLNQSFKDFQVVYRYSSKLLEKELIARVSKSYAEKEVVPIPADPDQVEFINEFLTSLESMAVAAEDLIQLMASVDLGEVQPQANAINDLPAKIRGFKSGAVVDALRILNSENVLQIQDKMFEPMNPDDLDENEDEPQTLLVTLSAGESPGPEYEKVQFNIEFKEIDHFKGIATGIVVPAGTPERRYLDDGGYFPKEVVTSMLFDFMLNAPVMNKDHNQDNNHNFWEHPDFRLIEVWQCRARFQLNGNWVEEGDWVMTIMAISDNFKEELKIGRFNGFSIEAYVAYIPDELLARP